MPADEVTVVRRLGALLGVLVWLWIGTAAPAEAASRVCVAGGTPAAPLDYHDPATWSPPGVPDATTDLVLASACSVRCNAGECHARTLKGTSAAGSFEIAPGASLVLSGCDTASAYLQNTYECGAENGFRFAPQGAATHDSALDGDPFLRGVALPAQPDRLRLALADAIDVAPGDWLQIRGGPTRSHVHRVVEVDLSGCPSDPATCRFDVLLHDPAMEFGTNALTSGFGTGIAYLAPGTMRIAGRDHPSWISDNLDRCVELCTGRSGAACTSAAAITRDHARVGWYLGASDAALDPANPAVMERRALIVDARNGVAETIGPGGGSVDRLCFAEPMPEAWIPETGYVDRPAVVWPGFWPGDPWVVFRPATVRYAGAEGDGGLGFHGACLDSDYAYFDGWAKLATRVGTAACQEPYQDTVITSWARGIAGQPMNQQAACNGHSLDLIDYTALAGDRVAIVDTRTEANASYTCYAGADPAPDSGYHGISLIQTRFDPERPPAEWLIRYAGDDGLFIGASSLGAYSYRFPRWSWWWNRTGFSTEVMDFLSAAPGQDAVLEDARVTMYASSTGCKGALDDPTGNVRYRVEGMRYVDPAHPGPVLGVGASSGHDVEDLLAFGPSNSSCAALSSARVRDSWIEGWNRLISTQVREVDGVRFAARGAATSGAIFGWIPEGESVVMRDFVLTGLAGVRLISPSCGTGCDFEMRDGFAAWTTPQTAGVASFYSSSTAYLGGPLEGLLFSNARLISCNATWGETGENIGRNLLYQAPDGIAIGNASACPLAAPQKLLSTTGLAAYLPVRAELEGERFGPRRRVGLSTSQAVTAGADLLAPFAVPEIACANGVDDDWDGAVDLADSGCDDAFDDGERTSAWQCDDGVDNDGDGFADAGFDPGCPKPASHPENPICDDGLDNDGDGFVDFADPHCSPTHPYSERPSGCGLGVELVGLALAIRWRARACAARRARRTS